MKLRTRFTLSAVSLVVFVTAVISVFIFIAERDMLLKEKQQQQLGALRGLAHAGREFIITQNRIQLLNYINQIRDTEAFAFADLTDVRGVIIAHSDVSLLGEKADIPPGLIEDGGAYAVSYAGSGEGELAVFSMPVNIDGREPVLARTGFSQYILNGIIEEELQKTARMIFSVSGIALLLGTFGASLMAFKMTGPIRKMTQGAALIGQGKLDTEILVKRKDELGSLANDLNKMAEKLRELDEMKQDFVSSVTHELRSPINALGMYFELFFKGSLGELTTDQKEALTFMRDSTVRLAKFIDDLLDTAKLERGKMEIAAQAFTLDEILPDVVKLYSLQAEGKKISLTSEAPGGLPEVYADPDRTVQVLNNLINNAIKFTPENGAVTVRAKLKDKKFVMVSVCDTGRGIPKAQLNSVFNKFEQVKGVRDNLKGPKGTGLGLAIVKGIVESQGGEIGVKSEEGKGAEFYFTLPLNKSRDLS